MSRLDLVIFGATGFTGKNVAQMLARGGKQYDGIKWGLAGRSQKKLDSVLAEITKTTGQDLSHVKLIVADVADNELLKEMCAQTKVLVNCCGPFQQNGEPVIRAAIEMKTHYVDITAELQFMERIQLEYDAQAREAGVYVICACGFASIPNDMGVIFLQQNFEGTLNSVESYLIAHLPSRYWLEAMYGGIINYGTWESLLVSYTEMDELPALREKLYPKTMPILKPALKPRCKIHLCGGRLCVPYPGPDNSAVQRSQLDRLAAGERPVQFFAYLKDENLFVSIVFLCGGIILYLMLKFKFTKQLVLDHPRFFSLGLITKKGPKDKMTNNTYFKFELIGKGWENRADIETTPPNKTMKATVTGVNPGYGATSIALLHSALTILREQDKMPRRGGAMTTAMAFRNTNIVQRLTESELKFEIVKC